MQQRVHQELIQKADDLLRHELSASTAGWMSLIVAKKTASVCQRRQWSLLTVSLPEIQVAIEHTKTSCFQHYPFLLGGQRNFHQINGICISQSSAITFAGGGQIKNYL